MNMLLSLVTLFLLARTSHELDPMENPDLFEGDMILTEKQKQEFLHGRDVDSNIPLAATNTRHWPKTIPYTIDSSLASESAATQVIAAAIADYEKLTCLVFKRRTTEPGYLEFYMGGGCSSPVGYFGRPNRISLARGCWVKGIVMHEIAHSLGFYHEQSRPDRDRYVDIIWQNIPTGLRYNFEKRKSSTIDSMNVPYDYHSVMHYGRYAFGRGKVTIETKNKTMTHSIGQRKGFSELDVLQMNLLYRCPGFTKPPTLITVKPATTSVVPGTFVKVELQSEGCDDIIKSTAYKCGKATIKVNGKDYSRSLRGLNIVVVDLNSGLVIRSSSFDTHGDATSTTRMTAYIDAIPSDTMVLIAAQDEASLNLIYPLTSRIRALGGTDITKFGYRGSYTLIGFKGRLFPSWVKEAYNIKGRGPTSLSILVSLTKGKTPAPPPSTFPPIPTTLPPPPPTTNRPGTFVKVELQSEGCDDITKSTAYKCGKATIKVNGKDYSRSLRGLNIVVVDLNSGLVIRSSSFDTHGDTTATPRMTAYIDAIPSDTMVLIAAQDEASLNLKDPLTSKIRALGSTDITKFGYRGSYTLIGFKGRLFPSWVKEAYNIKGKGPTSLSSLVSLTKGKTPAPPPSTFPPIPTTLPPPPPTTNRPARYIYVYVKSVACDDPNSASISKYPCGRAVIKVNGADFSRALRGFNIVAIRLSTGVTYSSANFDTHGSLSASTLMANYLDRLENDTIILAAVQDEASSALTTTLKNKLREVGGNLAPLLNWRYSYALIGYKGKHRPSWVRDNYNRRAQGPTELANRIPIGSGTSPTVPATKPRTTKATSSTLPVPTPPLPTGVPGQCGISPVPQSRVIGGKDAVPGAWPWQVALLKGGRFVCGGSLINSLWVVTAAHCISSQASGYTVVLGEHDRYNRESTEVSINVEKAKVHPSYSQPKRLNNDIALLKLVKPVQFTARIQPVCLPSSSEVIPVGSKCFITGWGKVKHPGSSHSILQQALLPVRGKEECSQRLKKSQGGSFLEITDQMLCAGEIGSLTRKSGCHGDSGGPYVCQTPSGAYQLHGAVSWGSVRCDIQDRFTVFARITALRSWIDQTMRQN